MLHQVLNNLISNSIKFSHPGSSIDITVTEEAGDLTHIAVRDYGVGMNEELLAKIFDTGEPTSHVGTAGEKGTGFGMPVVKSYMKLYGGDIKIKSWPETQYPENCGTEITLVFKSAPSDGERRAA